MNESSIDLPLLPDQLKERKVRMTESSCCLETGSLDASGVRSYFRVASGCRTF